MKNKKVTFADDYTFISRDNPQALEELVIDLFIQFVNDKYGKVVIERKN
ncbi:hypothetical protein [Bacillus litorisediminis]|nr:hypothetical protein [Bacillus litorisediminis]